MRIHSSAIFRENPDGSLTIIRPIRIGEVKLKNVTFSGGVKIGGMNLMELRNRELEVDDREGVYVINGYYQ